MKILEDIRKLIGQQGIESVENISIHDSNKMSLYAYGGHSDHVIGGDTKNVIVNIQVYTSYPTYRETYMKALQVHKLLLSDIDTPEWGVMEQELNIQHVASNGPPYVSSRSTIGWESFTSYKINYTQGEN